MHFLINQDTGVLFSENTMPRLWLTLSTLLTISHHNIDLYSFIHSLLNLNLHFNLNIKEVTKPSV